MAIYKAIRNMEITRAYDLLLKEHNLTQSEMILAKKHQLTTRQIRSIVNGKVKNR